MFRRYDREQGHPPVCKNFILENGLNLGLSCSSVRAFVTYASTASTPASGIASITSKAKPMLIGCPAFSHAFSSITLTVKFK